MWKIIPILMGVVISYVVAVIFQALGMTNADGSAIIDYAPIATAAWVGVPKFVIAKFDVTAILVMAPIAIATMMEHVGDISAISATTSSKIPVLTGHCSVTDLQLLLQDCSAVLQIQHTVRIQEFLSSPKYTIPR